ncbi:LppM family (lipo)protein [Gordonia polyisoprenivorans]|uniref:LppM family (lipo)protein n=1 Tax=Gordonia polyisoprenivorans TaxID=84595 RepID=UPI001AD65969|nr:DUF3153 domain-containing protein [Gordonia polyisoprenivorans]QTI67575.1 DUF3153 domain-containing protein [Gordonia polyisoprenivorans]
MSSVRPPITRLSPPRASAFVLTVVLLIAAPLMSGCLQRSTTVGDRFAGSVVVATSPDNPRGAPKFDIPESMTGNIAVSDYRASTSTQGSGAPASAQPSPSEDTDQPSSDSTPSDSAPSDSTQAAPTPQEQSGDSSDDATLVGSRATFSNLTAGQLSQLGDIIADAFGDTAMTMDLSAKRSGSVVRFRGSTDLTGLIPNRDYVRFTISFAGPITATNGDQNTNTSVSWTPEPGKSADFTAESTYADPSTAAFGGWTWLMVLICAAVVLVVIRLAYVSRDRSPRPGRPARAASTGGKKNSGKKAAGKKAAGTSATAATDDKATVPADAAPDQGVAHRDAGAPDGNTGKS